MEKSIAALINLVRLTLKHTDTSSHTIPYPRLKHWTVRKQLQLYHQTKKKTQLMMVKSVTILIQPVHQ